MNVNSPPDIGLDAMLLSRVEDASLNASAPPQPWWLDGWLVHASLGKAKRARRINAVADGRRPLPQSSMMRGSAPDHGTLPHQGWPRPRPAGRCRAARAAAHHALQPARGPGRLAGRTGLGAAGRHPGAGLHRAARSHRPLAPPAGLQWQPLGAADYAAAVGRLRGSPPGQQQGHAQRIAQSPTPYFGLALVDAAGQVQACGQAAREGRLVRLHDVHTRSEDRNQGLAHLLCERLLTLEAEAGAEIAYLQVEADNAAARAVYRRLGFAEACDYHYRPAPEPGGTPA